MFIPPWFLLNLLVPPLLDQTEIPNREETEKKKKRRGEMSRRKTGGRQLVEGIKCSMSLPERLEVGYISEPWSWVVIVH